MKHKERPKFKICSKCDIQFANDEEQLHGQDYCSKCIAKVLEYEADTFRKRYDIRYKDPKSLTWYQQAQLKAIKGYEPDGPQVS